MAAPASPEHIPYRIVAQEKTQQLSPAGIFQDVWKVSFEVPSVGVHSFIEVPVNEYNPANVDAKIQEEADAITGTHSLGPEPHPENLAE
jgi:hypothetical protein